MSMNHLILHKVEDSPRHKLDLWPDFPAGVSLFLVAAPLVEPGVRAAELEAVQDLCDGRETVWRLNNRFWMYLVAFNIVSFT